MPVTNLNQPLPVLAAVGAPVGDNMGGVQEIYLLPHAALLRNPIRKGPAIVGDLAVRAGAVWYPIRAVLDTAAFDQDFAEDRNEGLYTGKLSGFVAEDSPATAAALLAYRNVPLVLLYRDGNGRMKLAGDASSWYTLGYRHETKQATANRAGYSLELNGKTLRPALFYTGAFTVVDAGQQSGAQPGTGTGGRVEIRDKRGALMATVEAGRTVVLASGFRVALTII